MNTRKPLFAGCALLALAIAAPAFAQAQPPQEDEGTRVGEVTVTAEKREQSLQSIPVAISAYDDDTRNVAGILTIQDMAQFTPGVAYSTAADRPFIRGIGRESNFFSLDSPVANYIDGVYTSSVQDASRRPIFIERTEILRGPQGALSGRGSIAGAVNTISKRPEKTFGGEIGVQAGDYDRYGAEGTVTGPITDWLRGRLNLGIYRQDKGWFTNVADGHTEGDQPNNREIADIMLAADFGPKIEAFLKASFADYDETYRSTGATAPYQAGTSPCVPNIYSGVLTPSNSYGYFLPDPSGGNACGTTGAYNSQSDVLGGHRTNPVTLNDLRFFNSNYTSQQRLDSQHNYTGDVVWHGPGADFKYIGSHQEYDYVQHTDADGTAVVSYVLPTNNRRIFPSGVNLYAEEKTWYSHELNITSTYDSPIQWVAGLYQSNEEYVQSPSDQVYAGFDELDKPLDGVTFAPVAANLVHGRAQYGQMFGSTRSTAAFGQVDYAPTDQWKFTVGLRYNKDEKFVHEQTRLIYNNLSILAGAATPIALDITATQAPGYALVNPTTAVIPKGYRLADLSALPKNANGSITLPNGGGTVPVGMAVLLAPGVVGLPTVDPVTGNRMRDLKDDWQATTGNVGVTYTPNKDTLFYARYARGYRPGGFNGGGFISATPEVDKETVDSYELGSKFTLSGSFRLNTAVFYYDYKDIQLPLSTFERCITPGDFTTCTAISSFVNLPTAANKGIEFEGIWAPTNDFQMIFTYGYLDAKIKNGKTAIGFQNTGGDPAALLAGAQRLLPITCVTALPPPVQVPGGPPVGPPAPGCQERTVDGKKANYAIDSLTNEVQYTQDLSGNPEAFAPKNKIAVNANYTFRNVMQRGDVTLSASYIWTDSSKSDFFNSINETPSNSQTNLRALFSDKDQKYQIIVYAQNVFDQDVVEFGTLTRRAPQTGFGQVYYPSYDLAPPRTIGIEVQRRF